MLYFVSYLPTIIKTHFKCFIVGVCNRPHGFTVYWTLGPHELQMDGSITRDPGRHLFLSLGNEWEYNALNLTVPKALSVAPVYDLSPLSFSWLSQALHNCLSASGKSREQLGKDKPHAPSARLGVQRLTLRENQILDNDKHIFRCFLNRHV